MDKLDCTSSRQSVFFFWSEAAWAASTKDLALEVRMGVTDTLGAVLASLVSSSVMVHDLPMFDRITVTWVAHVEKGVVSQGRRAAVVFEAWPVAVQLLASSQSAP